MDLKLFNKLMIWRPSQQWPEWRAFIEICEMHLNKYKIKNPIVVELGIWRNRQREFYKQLLGAHHIGIDFTSKRGKPDICGDTHDPKTFRMLKEKLGGKPINILFIDAGHGYEDVKKDFKMYAPLCSDIVALHDIAPYRYVMGNPRGRYRGVHRFWAELNEAAYQEKGKYEEFLFLSIHQCQYMNKRRRLGIGVMIKK